MTPPCDLDELRRWLDWWGRLMAGGAGPDGYPSRSVEGRLRDDGGVLPAASYAAPTIGSPFPPEVEAVEQAMVQLRKNNQGRYWAQLLALRYVSRRLVCVQAKTVRLSERRYREHVNAAEAALWGVLCAHP